MVFLRNSAGLLVRTAGPATYLRKRLSGELRASSDRSDEAESSDRSAEYRNDLTTRNPATASESAGAADSNGVQTVTLTVSNPALNGNLFVRLKAL